ncbi:hypothetical protein [Microbulbifer epialgicus]|uniref:Uncharacterized protein n=1 Tax=Microbulbifer epialgicus TaxID=393907 RepID=A0ABV4P2T6_9GAMM
MKDVCYWYYRIARNACDLEEGVKPLAEVQRIVTNAEFRSMGGGDTDECPVLP